MRSKLREDRSNVFDLVIVASVAHPWINPFCDNRLSVLIGGGIT
jgi:hypothetical protein